MIKNKFDYYAVVKLANRASDAYYNTDVPIMSDAEFDELIDNIAAFEHSSGIIASNSPTQNVGAPVLSELKKVKITPRPMLSLAKCHSAEEVKDFIGDKIVIAMVKLDGLSVRLKYHDGRLVSANTRGNGEVGTDISAHARQFINIPLEIPDKKDWVIDGEAVIKLSDFAQINKDGQFANPRNTASGALNLLDTNEVKKRRLSFIAWDVIEPHETNSLAQNLQNISDFGFDVVPFIKGYEQNAIEKDNDLVLSDLASDLPCDGVVWKFNDIAYGESLGRVAHDFKNAIAFKPKNEEAETTLKNIEWSASRTGQLTPVAIFDPVELDGSTISRASLSNVSVMRETFGTPYSGQRMKVLKANYIIPHVSWADKDMMLSKEQVLKVPSVCPYCGKPTKIVVSDTGIKNLICTNNECRSKLINILAHFCNNKGLDIKNLSKQTIQKLIDWNWLNNQLDIFKLKDHREEWIKKDGFGPKSVDRILDSIESAKRSSLWRLISAAGIPLIGVETAKQLAKYFKTWDNFRNAIRANFDFTQLSDIAESTEAAIKNFDYNIIDEVAKELEFSVETSDTEDKSTLDGMKIVITGSLNHFHSRNELKDKIESLGGKVVGSVSKNTSLLICNDIESTSSKMLRAKELKIPIMTEEKFISEYLK